MIIELLLIAIIFLSAIVYKNKTIYIALSAIMLFFFAFATEHADFLAYAGRYSWIKNRFDIFSQEPAFGILMWICNLFNLSYNTFLVILFLIGLIIISKCLYKYSETPALILAIYFLLFFSGHIAQIRAYIAEWIVIFALLYISTEESAKKWKYILLIFLASAFQIATIFFLPFFIVKPSKRLKFKSCIIVIIFLAMLSQLKNILLSCPVGILRERLLVYLSTDNRHMNTYSLVFGLFFILMFLYVLRLSKKCFDAMEKDWARRFEILSEINTLALIPLTLIFVYGNNFFRYNRVVIMVNAILLINYYKARNAFYSKARGVVGCACAALFIMGEFWGQIWYYQIIHNDLVNIVF